MLCTNVLIIQICVALAATINGDNIQITTYRKIADVKPSDIERITTNYDCTCTVSKSFMSIKVCVKKDLKGKIIFDNKRVKTEFFFSRYVFKNIHLESSLPDAPVKISIFRNKKVMILGK